MIAWLKRWGWLVCFVLFAVLVIVLTAGKVRPDIKAEVDAAKAEADAEKRVARVGLEAAKKEIEVEYAETIKRLDEKERTEAAELRDDPMARARYYARVASKHSRKRT